ncbi:MAG: hypothetical protein HGB08_01070 [Candidatus Moranbacteria bacterium]|nr:hypothetical protein [Candidatus Moranbacteria bacterium]
MKIFIDLDDVLFNAKMFVADLKKAFLESGIPEDLFDRFYIDYPIKGPNGVRMYNVWKHLDLIRGSGEDVSKAEEAVGSLMASVGKYLFGDVADFLEDMKGNSLFLVSYGETEFQRAKMGSLSRNEAFLECVVSENAKSEVIGELLKRHDIRSLGRSFFIDDRLENIQDIKNRFPEMTTILMHRKEGRYQDPADETCDYVVENLLEAGKIIIS